jgi:hypothetical protein
LLRVGVALSAETDTNRLLETILLEAKELTRADGGTLYIRQDEDSLHFAIMRTDSLGIAIGGTTGRPTTLPPIPLRDPDTGAPNHRHIASYAALRKASINIPNAYDTTRFIFAVEGPTDELVNAVLLRGKSFLLEAGKSPSGARPTRLRSVTGDVPACVAPIAAQGKVIGLFYGDNAAKAGAIDGESFESFAHFVQQVSLAFDKLARRG